MADENSFDWGAAEEDIAIRPVQAIAVFRNVAGDAVIRQQALWPHDVDDDGIVILPLDRILDLIAKLQQIAREAELGNRQAPTESHDG